MGFGWKVRDLGMTRRIDLKLDLGQLSFRHLFDRFPGFLGLLGPLSRLGRRLSPQDKMGKCEDTTDEQNTAGYTATGHEYYLTPTSMLQHYKV